MRRPKRLSACMGLLFLTCVALAEDAPVVKSVTSVGVSARMELIVEGTEIEPVPYADARQPVVVRLISVFPHGSAFRYDLEYYGLEAGEFNLADYLRRKLPAPADAIPAIPIRVASVLGKGSSIPNSLPAVELPRLGGYRMLLWVGGVAWIVVLLLIIFAGRSRRPPSTAKAPVKRSMADELRPLVERAVSGGASPEELATLEQLLLTYWRKRLHLEQLSPREAMAALKRDSQASVLVGRLEDWLHRGRPSNEDVNALLAPYRNLPAESASLEPVGARS